jgi:predicted DNA-binding transcriptional regulator YafY
MGKRKAAEDFDPTNEVPEEKEALRVLQRRWDLLNAIPSFGRSVGKQDLATRLYSRHSRRDDVAVSPKSFLRYIQRDLEILSRAINSLRKEQIISTRQGVSWGESGSPFRITGLSTNETLAFGMLKKLGVSWMPASMREALNPYFESAMQEAAQRVGELAALTPKKAELQAKKWLDKIEQLPETIAFENRPIKKDVEKVVHQALLEEYSLEIVYQGKPRRVICPQALIQKGVRTYLLANSIGGSRVVTYLMDRIDSARISPERYQAIAKSEIQSCLKSGISAPKFIEANENEDGVEYGTPIKLQLIVDSGTAKNLSETPIGRDQVIAPAQYSLKERWAKIKVNPLLKEESDEGWSFVNVTVLLQEELIWWLRSMGPFVKVIGPDFIRDRIEYDIKRALANYTP